MQRNEDRGATMCNFEKELVASMGLLKSFALMLERGNKDKVEDLVQETVLAAWMNRRTFRGEGPFAAWLIGILKHKSLTAHRQARRAEYGADKYEEWLGQQFVIPNQLDHIELNELCGYLGTLSEPHQAVLIGMRVLGHTIEELAQKASVPEGTIKSRMNYAHRALLKRS